MQIGSDIGLFLTLSFMLWFSFASLLIGWRDFKQVAEEPPEFLEAIIQYSKLREQYKEAVSTGGDNNWKY